MKLIVGLGNPSGKFEFTRHNIGFMVIEKFLRHKLPILPSLKAWKKDEKHKSEIYKHEEFILIKPQTYMNLSGLAVASVARFYKISPSDIWVVQDDIDLPIGKIRIRKGGASAGHRGIESIIKELGSSDFFRFRLGIGRGKLEIKGSSDQNLHRQDVEKFVVSPFRDNEGGAVKKLIKYAVEALEIAQKEGIDRAMNRFN